MFLVISDFMVFRGATVIVETNVRVSMAIEHFYDNFSSVLGAFRENSRTS